MKYLNPLAWVADGLKVRPEPPSFPEEIEEASLEELASARNRLREISAVATDLRRLVDSRMVERLDGAGYRYGNSILRAGPGKRSTSVKDPSEWWRKVVEGLKKTPNPDRLLDALYPASELKISGLPFLATALSVDPAELRNEYLLFESSGSGLSEIPIEKAPKFLQRLREGETSYGREKKNGDLLEVLTESVELLKDGGPEA